MPDDEALAEGRAAVADGVRALQVKGGQDVDRDVRVIAGLRQALGDGVVLRLDANGGYVGRTRALHALAALAEAGADFVEQPLLGLANLEAAHSQSPVPVIADEACWSPADALELVGRRAVDALSVYVGKAGRHGPRSEVCTIARAAGLPHDLNGALELGIGNAANLHVALSSPADLLPSVIPSTPRPGRGDDDRRKVLRGRCRDEPVRLQRRLAARERASRARHRGGSREGRPLLRRAPREHPGGGIAMAKVGITCGGVWWPPEYFQAVEELGFDSIWTGEHIVFHRPILDAVPVLAGIAAVTNRISLGPAAILTPLRNPTMLAKELATLDIMSGGRLIVVAGVGGDFEKEFEAAGVPMAGRGRRTSETIEIMRKYWTEDQLLVCGHSLRARRCLADPQAGTARRPTDLARGTERTCDRARRRARGRVHAVHVHRRALSLGVRGGAREGGCDSGSSSAPASSSPLSST